MLIKSMANKLLYKGHNDEEAHVLWIALHEILSKVTKNTSLTDEEEQLLREFLAANGHNLNSLRSEAFSGARSAYETLDRLIERQLKNVKLVMQAYDSVRFAPQIYEKMVLEIEQLEQQVERSREDQRLEVDRQ